MGRGTVQEGEDGVVVFILTSIRVTTSALPYRQVLVLLFQLSRRAADDDSSRLIEAFHLREPHFCAAVCWHKAAESWVEDVEDPPLDSEVEGLVEGGDRRLSETNSGRHLHRMKVHMYFPDSSLAVTRTAPRQVDGATRGQALLLGGLSAPVDDWRDATDVAAVDPLEIIRESGCFLAGEGRRND
jgi:hypothetical protein